MSQFPARPQHLAGKMVFLSYSGWSELKLYCSFKLDQLPFSNGWKHRIFPVIYIGKVWVLYVTQCGVVSCCTGHVTKFRGGMGCKVEGTKYCQWYMLP